MENKTKLTDEIKKRDLKKFAKIDEKVGAQLAKAMEPGKWENDQQMINQNIIYAPQIIFMGKERDDGKHFMEENPERKSKFYYYDPQRIEKQNLPVFKTERVPMNRPGYAEKYGRKNLD